jgi:predicted transcriptional regulator YdeE
MVFKMMARLLLITILASTITACNSTISDMDDKVQISSFKIVGISVRTTNQDGRSMADMGQLWNRFYSEDIISLIPNKVSDDIYSIYTDYETDYKGTYTAIIGCKVNSLDSIPKGLIVREFQGGRYSRYIAKGKMPDAVINQWKTIWEKDTELNRKYTADFEVYGQKSRDPDNAEIEVYVATQ